MTCQGSPSDCRCHSAPWGSLCGNTQPMRETIMETGRRRWKTAVSLGGVAGSIAVRLVFNDTVGTNRRIWMVQTRAQVKPEVCIHRASNFSLTVRLKSNHTDPIPFQVDEDDQPLNFAHCYNTERENFLENLTFLSSRSNVYIHLLRIDWVALLLNCMTWVKHWGYSSNSAPVLLTGPMEPGQVCQLPRLLRSSPNCPLGFRSGIWDGRSKTLTVLSSRHFLSTFPETAEGHCASGGIEALLLCFGAIFCRAACYCAACVLISQQVLRLQGEGWLQLNCPPVAHLDFVAAISKLENEIGFMI